MAEIEAKVNMSLDDIIKMEKKKKANAQKNQKRGGGGGGRARGGGRGNQRNQRGRGNQNNQIRGRSRSQNRQNNNNRRGQYNRRFNNMRNGQGGGGGGFKNFNSINNKPKTNLRRSRSNMSLNRMNGNNNVRRGSFGMRRGGKFGGGLTRSRSRNNLSYNKPFINKNKAMGGGGAGGAGGFLKRTSSMPNLSDPNSVYNRLGYQNPTAIAYRNRVKRAKNVLIQRHSKAMKMQNALMLSPTKNLPPLNHKMPARRYSAGALRSDQMARAQKRAQYEQKLMRMSVARTPAPISYDYNDYLNHYAAMNPRHPAMALYDGPMENRNSLGLRQLPRGRSPFRRNLQSVKSEPNSPQAGRSASYSRQQKRARSRSRSRPRQPRNSINLVDNDIADRSFSEVMYSLSSNFGVTTRTLNDRFSFV